MRSLVRTGESGLLCPIPQPSANRGWSVIVSTWKGDSSRRPSAAGDPGYEVSNGLVFIGRSTHGESIRSQLKSRHSLGPRCTQARPLESSTWDRPARNRHHFGRAVRAPGCRAPPRTRSRTQPRRSTCRSRMDLRRHRKRQSMFPASMSLPVHSIPGNWMGRTSNRRRRTPPERWSCRWRRFARAHLPSQNRLARLCRLHRRSQLRSVRQRRSYPRRCHPEHSTSRTLHHHRTQGGLRDRGTARSTCPGSAASYRASALSRPWLYKMRRSLGSIRSSWWESLNAESNDSHSEVAIDWRPTEAIQPVVHVPAPCIPFWAPIECPARRAQPKRVRRHIRDRSTVVCGECAAVCPRRGVGAYRILCSVPSSVSRS